MRKGFLAMLLLSFMLSTDVRAQESALSIEDMFYQSSFYSVSQSIEIEVLKDNLNLQGGLQNQRVELPLGTEIAIIEERLDSNEGLLRRIGVEIPGEPAFSSLDIWVRASDLEESSLDQIHLLDGIETSDFEVFKQTYCYRYVKLYLLKIGKVKTYLPGGSAYMAASILPKHGFRRTGHSPWNAREGEVCVYAGGPQGHGHIEVKRNGKWWYGYGYKSKPISNRRFLGCFNK